MSEQQQQQNDSVNNFDKLKELIGEEDNSLAVFVDSVVEEVRKEKENEKRAQVKKLITTAIEIQHKMEKIDKEYNSQKQKWNKELGKLINRLKGDYSSNLTLPEVK